jgi:hypothetical protein
MTMMGTKTRTFAPLINVSLEDLVPANHFYRHLELERRSSNGGVSSFS